VSSELPLAVSRHIERENLQGSAAASFSFSANWQLLGRNGQLQALGLESLSDAAASTLLRDVCSGLAKLHGPPIAQLTLPNGTACELHLIAESDRFHTLLLDRRAQIEALRTLQQASQEHALSALARGKQLKLARVRIAELTRERDALRSTLARERAKRLLRLATPELHAQTPTLLHARVQALVAPLAQARAVRLELELNASLDAPLHELDPEAALGLPVYAIVQALLRASSGSTVKATLRVSARALQISVKDSGPALSEAERAWLWQEPAPGADGDDLALALYAMNALCREGNGRVTLPAEADAAVTLSASLPRIVHITERSTPNTLALDGQRLALWGDFTALTSELTQAGATLELHEFAESALPALNAANPPALLVRPGTQTTLAKRLIFKLRALGFGGRVIALSATPPAGAAWWDAWLLEPLEIVALRIALGNLKTGT